MEFILFPSYLSPYMDQDIFHYGAIKLGQVLVELSIREESLMESVDRDLLVAKRDGDLFSIEPSHVVSQ